MSQKWHKFFWHYHFKNRVKGKKAKLCWNPSMFNVIGKMNKTIAKMSFFPILNIPTNSFELKIHLKT
jgi:hypothetical protein